MAISVRDFWKAVVAAKLISLEEAKQLHAVFSRTPGAENANGPTLARWLIDSGVLSRFQATELIGGRSGPFTLGDYKIVDRVAIGPLKGLYRAVHSSGQAAMLFLWTQPGGAATDWAIAQEQAQNALATKYPHAGRVFGLVEADGQRFLVLEDNVDLVATSVPMQTAAAPAASRPIPSRPVLAPKPVPVPANGAAHDRFDDLPMGGLGGVNRPQLAAKFNASNATAIGPRKDNTMTIVALLAGGAIVTALVAFLVLPGSKHEPKSKKGKDTEIAKSETKGSETDTKPIVPTDTAIATNDSKSPPRPTTSDSAVIEDDGKTLWVSPTSGPPVDLHYLPLGGQLFIAVRPDEILAHPEGEKILSALGPPGTFAADAVKSATGVPLEEMERLLVAFYPVEGAPPDSPPDVAMVVTLRSETSTEKLLAAWNNPKEAGKEKKFYQGGKWAYYVPAEGKNKIFAVTNPTAISEVAEAEGPPGLRREMEKLIKDTDDTRHFTLLVAPNFLFGDGRAVLAGDLAKLKQPLIDFLGEGVQAVSLSFHLANDFFAELQAYGTLDKTGFELASAYRKQIDGIPDSVESYLVEISPQPYGKSILFRMPGVIKAFAEYTRVGEENKHAVLRTYLPAVAAHNLVLGTELALAERPGGAAPATAAAAPRKPTTLAEALKQKIDLSFPRNTLETCMNLLAESIEAEAYINGDDLKLEGITKNQSFGLDEKNKPADEILRKVMALANPDGKLVYVLKPKEKGGKDVIYITTRAAVAQRGDKLPPELEQAPAKK